MINAIILLSGGIDSVTALYWALNKGYHPLGLTFDGFDELDTTHHYIKKIVHKTGIMHLTIPIPYIKYAEALKKEGISLLNAEKYPSDYVPAKNLIYFSIASYYAAVYNTEIIIKGLIKSDFDKFPDNSYEYFRKLESIINISIGFDNVFSPKIEFPLKEYNKPEVIQLALELEVPLELTWSCYEEEYKDGPCGKCKGCIERISAFKSLSIEDPYLMKRKNIM